MSLSQINSSLTGDSLRNNAEGQYLERKGRDTRPTKIANELIGMLNAGGGVLVYGIADDGIVEDLRHNALGPGIPHDLDPYRKLIHDFIRPPANIELEEVFMDTGELIFLFHVDQDYERLFQRADSEEVFLRVAESNRKLDREQVKALEYNKQIRKFEDEALPDFDPDDLDRGTCAAYITKIEFKGTFEELALKRHLATRRDGKVTYKNCAVLLFAKNPEKYIPNASVRYVRYKGDVQKSGKEYNVIKDQRFEDNVPSLIDSLENFIEASLRDYYFLDMDGGVFRRIPEFPKDAWIEGIVNALCHRSYNIQGNPILIRHFENRLEISNSGPLPAQVTVENIRTERFARNIRIARVLADLGFVRELNEGVPRIYGAMAELSLAMPEYTDHANTVTLTLRNKVTEHQKTIIDYTFDLIQNQWGRLNETQRDIINLVLNRQEVTIGDVIEQLHVSEQAVRNNLKKLIELQIIEKVSDKQRDVNAIYRFMPG